MPLIATAKKWARRVKQDVLTVYFAARDPKTPRMVRWLAFAVAAYALSPIDLIPDFIPVVGYLDDLLIVPLGIIWVIRLLPPPVLEAARSRAALTLERPSGNTGLLVVLLIWLAVAAGAAYWYFRPV